MSNTTINGWVEKYSSKLGGEVINNNDDDENNNSNNNNNNDNEIVELDVNTPLISSSYPSSSNLSSSPSSYFSSSSNKKRWINFKRRAPYYIPSTQWIPNYQLSNLIHDVFAGLSVGVMLVPQSLSYASLANLPGVYGLYTACIPVMIYAFFGHSRELSVGPEVVSSMLTGTTLRQVNMTHFEENFTNEEMASFGATISFIVGVCTLLMGLVRFGFLSEILSRPLIRGFILAVALTIIVEQLDALLGLKFRVESWRKIPLIIQHWNEIEYTALAMGLSSISFLLLFNFAKARLPPRLSPFSTSTSRWERIYKTTINVLLRILHLTPPIVIVVVLGISITYGLELEKKGLMVLGKQPSGLPIPAFPPLDRISIVSSLIQPALVTSIIGFVVSMAVAKNFAAEKNYQVSANRELVALGIANLFGSMMWAFPAFGALTRSAVNSKAGVRTQLSGFVSALVILITLLFLMPVFKYLPLAVNSSILVVAGIGLIDLKDVYFLWHMHAWVDIFLLITTCIVTFVFGSSVGLLISIGASILIVIKHTSIPRVLVLGQVPSTGKFKDIAQYPEAKQLTGILMIKIEEALTFTNMNMLKEMLWRLELLGNINAHPTDPRAADNTHCIILDIKSVPNVDPSSIQILNEMVTQYKNRGIKVCFTHLKNAHKEVFLRSGVIQLVGPENFFPSIATALQHFNNNKPVDTSSYVL